MENTSTLRNEIDTKARFACDLEDRSKTKLQSAHRYKLLLAHDGYQPVGYEIGDLQKAGLPKDTEVEILTVADLFLPPLYLSDGDAPELGYYYDDRLSGQYGMPHVSELFHKMTAASNHARTQLKAAFPSWTIRNTVSAELASPALIDKAVRWCPDLVLLGSAKLSWFERRGLRTLTRRLVTEAGCSVRVARDKAHSASLPARILLGFDGSKQAQAALATLSRRDWPAGSEVFLVSCVEPVIVADEFGWREDYLGIDHNRLKAEVGKAKRSLEECGLRVTSLMPIGDPAQALLNEAKRFSVDSIVVGTRGLGVFGNLISGSVSSAVAARADCSVEIVRSRPEAEPISYRQRMAA